MPSLLRRKRLLVLGGVALFLVLLEAGLRAFHFERPLAETPITVWTPDRDPLLATKDYLFMPDNRALWTLRPGAAIQSTGDADGAEQERINLAGYRGPLLPFEKTRGVVRILVLGDSTAFGVGVRYADTFSAALVALLADQGVTAEVIDGGVGGYTVRQGIERYREMRRNLRPDLVIAAFGTVNEYKHALGYSDDDKIAELDKRKGGLAGFFRRVHRHLRVAQLATWLRHKHAVDEVMAASDEARRREPELSIEDGQTDWKGTRRVSLGEFRVFISELRRDVGAAGARLILVAMPRSKVVEDKNPVLLQYTRAVLSSAIEADVQVLDAHARFAQIAADDADEKRLLLDPWHPTPLGHKLIAQWLAPLVRDALRNRGGDPASASVMR
jgi:lysophospholipase L1-like esterase